MSASTVQSIPMYRWRIPSLSEDKKYLLCHGWLRKNCNKHIVNHLIKLFSTFYTNDDYLLKDIKNAEYPDFFTSKLININTFSFYLEVCTKLQYTTTLYIPFTLKYI